jgi:hypothetical protein
VGAIRSEWMGGIVGIRSKSLQAGWKGVTDR